MPSRGLAVALAVLVACSGCSAVPGVDGGGAGEETRAEGPDYHGLVFASNTGGESFKATVTVEKDGETLHEQTVEGDGNGTYLNLTTLDESGPYAVTVDTTLPAAGSGNMSKQVEVNGSLGNETVVDVTYQRIAFESYSLPTQEMEEPLYLMKLNEDPVPKTVVVTYEGETVVSETVEREGHGPFEVGALERTGVYQVSMTTGDGEWTNETVVVTHPEQKLIADFREDERTVELYPAGASLPRT